MLVINKLLLIHFRLRMHIFVYSKGILWICTCTCFFIRFFYFFHFYFCRNNHCICVFNYLHSSNTHCFAGPVSTQFQFLQPTLERFKSSAPWAPKWHWSMMLSLEAVELIYWAYLQISANPLFLACAIKGTGSYESHVLSPYISSVISCFNQTCHDGLTPSFMVLWLQTIDLVNPAIHPSSIPA